MSAMRRVQVPMFRYGERDFDESYLAWGFHDRATQLQEAESVLRIAAPPPPVRILDLACGIGTHAVRWAAEGHHVTAVDISETFIVRARQAAREAGAEVEFIVEDISRLDYAAAFDLVTWIEHSFFDTDALARIRRFLRPGGRFIFDVRNPAHPKARALSGNWRTWREEDGLFHLERHETEESGDHVDTWVTIDPTKEVIEERVSRTPAAEAKASGFAEKLKQVHAAGFRTVELRTMEGELFGGGEEPYWLWAVATK